MVCVAKSGEISLKSMKNCESVLVLVSDGGGGGGNSGGGGGDEGGGHERS